MSMSKKDFIALADALKWQNAIAPPAKFNDLHLAVLADFCQSQNPNFKRERWLMYIKGECGPNGGDIEGKRHKTADRGHN